MRLIDADELKKWYEPYKGLDVPCAVVCERIDSMPTMQPQGIEELRQRMKKHPNTIFRYADLERYIAVDDAIKIIEESYIQQPQGYDKERLIEKLKKEADANAGGLYIEQILNIINQQPTTDGWIPVSDAVDIGYLHDWYITSVMDDEPVWTEKHLEELFNDFILIPKPLPPAYKESEEE